MKCRTQDEIDGEFAKFAAEGQTIRKQLHERGMSDDEIILAAAAAVNGWCESDDVPHRAALFSIGFSFGIVMLIRDIEGAESDA